MSVLPRVCLFLWLALLMGSACLDPPLLEVEQVEMRVEIVQPEEGAPLPLSSATEFELRAQAQDAKIEGLELVVRQVDCGATEHCAQVLLRADPETGGDGKARLCLTTTLAAPDICPGWPRLDVAGLQSGHPFRARARVIARRRRSHVALSAPVELVLSDDRAPRVFLESRIPFEDDLLGPGDRIDVALRVVDEQSGVGSVRVRTRGLGGKADAQQDWTIPSGATEVRGIVTLAVDQNFLCPGTFTIEAEVSDIANPPNVAHMELGQGCVGNCSDHEPPALDQLTFEYPSGQRDPPFATAGDMLTLSFDTESHLFLDQPPVVELIHRIPGHVGPDAKGDVVAAWDRFEVSGSQVASYVYRYTVAGDEPEGPYEVRVTATDTHCNVNVVSEFLILDFTAGPSNLRVEPAQRGSSFVSLQWDLPQGQNPPLHLWWQRHDGAPLPHAYQEQFPPPQTPPYILSGLQPASRYAFKLVSESATTAGLFSQPATIDQVCTLPLAPDFQLTRSTQISMTVATGRGGNPPGTPLALYRCASQACGSGVCVPPPLTSANCRLLSDDVQGEQQIDGLQSNRCYALVLVARGCARVHAAGFDEALSAVCARTQESIPPPSWVQVIDRSANSITFAWQRVGGGSQDRVVAYDVADAGGQVLQQVEQPPEGEPPHVVVSGLAPGERGQIQVRVLRESGGVGVFGPLAVGHALTVAARAPTGQATGADQLRLQLNAGANGNNCANQFSVLDDQLGLYVQHDGTLAALEVFAPVTPTCPGAFTDPTVLFGLAPDSDHRFVLSSRNGDAVLGPPSPSSQIMVTLAAVPLAPALRSLGPNAIAVRINNDPNPARTSYAIGVDSRFVSLAGARVSAAEFATRAQWLAVSDVRVHGLAPDTNHQIYLVARNAAGQETVASTTASVITAPQAPGNLRALTSGSQSVRVSYSGAGNPSDTIYEVEETSQGTLYTGTQLNFQHNGLSADNAFSYRVRARGRDGQQMSPWVGPVVVITDPALPPAPRVVTRDETRLQIDADLSGDSNPPTTEYAFTVDGRYLDPSGTLLGSSAEDRAFVAKTALSTVTVTGLNPARLYELRLVARGINGVLIAGPTIYAATLPMPPGVLSTAAGVDEQHEIQLTWTAGGNPANASYQIERRLGLAGTFASIDSSDAFNWTDGAGSLAPLQPGATYSYRVRALAHGQLGAPTAPAVWTTAAEAPAAPSVAIPASGAATQLQIDLAVDGNHAWVEYALSVVRAGVPLWVHEAGSADSLQASPEWHNRSAWGTTLVDGLQANTLYELAARARDIGGGPEQGGPRVQAWTAAEAPASMTATPTQIDVTLSWPASIASSYQLLRQTACTGSWGEIATPTALTFLDTSLAAATSYCYRIHGRNGSSTPAPSTGYASTSTSTLASTPLAATDVVVRNTPGAQSAAASDSPITVLQPYFSARHNDRAAPTDAVGVRLVVQQESSHSLVTDTYFDLTPPLAAGSKNSDVQLPYLIHPLREKTDVGFAVASTPDRGAIYVLTGNGGTFRVLDLSTNVWATLASPTATPAAGAALAYDAISSRLFAVIGGGRSAIEVYSIPSGNWQALADASCINFDDGAAAVTADIGGELHLFVYPGSGSNIAIYNEALGQWRCSLQHPYASSGAGAALAVAGGSLFFQPGAGTKGLAAMSLSGVDVAADNYASFAKVAPSNLPRVYQGGSLVAAGARKLALLTGAASSSALYEYSFTAGRQATGTIQHLADVPSGVIVGNRFGGPRLAYDSTRDRIYLLHGEGEEIWYYDSTGPRITGYPGATAQALILNGDSYRFYLRFSDTDGAGHVHPWQNFVATP